MLEKLEYKNLISNFASQNARRMIFFIKENYNLKIKINII
jgi:hypothetical protein